MSITAVIFDMDGVLSDSAEAHLESWRLLAGELGREVTEQQFSASFGRQNRDIVPLLFGDGLTEERIRELSGRKEVLYRESVRGRVRAIEGAVELVRGCREAGLKLAVGSSAPRENVELVLEGLGIGACFEVIVHDGDVSRGKPDPEVFAIAAERLGVAPACCVVIEDAPSGVAAALAAGMTVIGLTTHHRRDRLAGAHLVTDSLQLLTAGQLAGMQVGHWIS